MSVFAHNHGSFEQFREQSLQGIEGEVATGRILEFVDGPPCNPSRVNRLGSVPKNRGETIKRRGRVITQEVDILVQPSQGAFPCMAGEVAAPVLGLVDMEVEALAMGRRCGCDRSS